MQPIYDDIKVCIVFVKCEQSQNYHLLFKLYQKNDHIMQDKKRNISIFNSCITDISEDLFQKYFTVITFSKFTKLMALAKLKQ